MADLEDDPNNADVSAKNALNPYIISAFLNSVETCARRIGMSNQEMTLAIGQSDALWKHMFAHSGIPWSYFDEYKFRFETELWNMNLRQDTYSPPKKKRKIYREPEWVEEIREEIRDFTAKMDARGVFLMEWKEKLEKRHAQLEDWHQSLRSMDTQHWRAMQITCCDRKTQVATSEMRRLRVIEDYKDLLLKLIQQLHKAAVKKMTLANKKMEDATRIVKTLKEKVSWKTIEEGFADAKELLQHVEELDNHTYNDEEYISNLKNLENGFVRYSRTAPERAPTSNFAIIGVLEYKNQKVTDSGKIDEKEEKDSEDMPIRPASAPPEFEVPVYPKDSEDSIECENSETEESSGDELNDSSGLSQENQPTESASMSSEAAMESEVVAENQPSDPSSTASEAVMESETTSETRDSNSAPMVSGATVESGVATDNLASESSTTSSEAPQMSPRLGMFLRVKVENSKFVLVPSPIIFRPPRHTSPEPPAASSEDEQILTSSGTRGRSEMQDSDAANQIPPVAPFLRNSEASMAPEVATGDRISESIIFLSPRPSVEMELVIPSRATSPEHSGAFTEDRQILTSSEARVHSEVRNSDATRQIQPAVPYPDEVASESTPFHMEPNEEPATPPESPTDPGAAPTDDAPEVAPEDQIDDNLDDDEMDYEDCEEVLDENGERLLLLEDPNEEELLAAGALLDIFNELSKPPNIDKTD